MAERQQHQDVYHYPSQPRDGWLYQLSLGRFAHDVPRWVVALIKARREETLDPLAAACRWAAGLLCSIG